MSEPLMYVVFDKDTGAILSIGNEKDDTTNYITAPLSEVLSLKQGVEPLTNYAVQYNPKTKDLELTSIFEQVLDLQSVNEFIYEIPEKEINDTDIDLVQDIPNACWKIKIGKGLKQSIKSKGVNLNSNMMFSVTEKGDPNILYKTLSAHIGQALSDNYYIVPFTMPFESTPCPISVYTARKFDTYRLTRIFNE